MLKRTPVLGLVIAGLVAILVMWLIEDPARPFTRTHALIVYCVAFLPSLGVALLFDPVSRATKEHYLTINFYEEKH